MEAARERKRLEEAQALEHMDMQLSSMSRLTGIDFSKFPFDEPLPQGLTTNGHQSSLAKWIGKTPRSILQSYARKGGVDFTGTADHVAGMMQDIMEVCDGLVPELQRRGVTRKQYAHKHLRDNLLEF